MRASRSDPPSVGSRPGIERGFAGLRGQQMSGGRVDAGPARPEWHGRILYAALMRSIEPLATEVVPEVGAVLAPPAAPAVEAPVR